MVLIFDMFEDKFELDERLRHIAIIMDGNGRWANKRGLPREAGHIRGAETFKKIIEYCKEINSCGLMRQAGRKPLKAPQ